ncbi:MAG: hypothetical protein QM811_07415 [Pirellulales bacterium]
MEPTATPIGMRLMSDYLLPFEIVSVHLLVVLVGAAYMARARNAASRPTFRRCRKPLGRRIQSLLFGSRFV